LSIEIQCAGCESHLRVADSHAGKQARCPKCGTIQTIPGTLVPQPAATPSLGNSPTGNLPEFSAAAARPNAGAFGAERAGSPYAPAPRGFENGPDEWYLRTPDGREYGPVPRRELNNWVGENRVSTQCRIRRALGDWTPATTHYPDLPTGTQRIDSTPSAGWTPTSIYPERHRGGLILALGIIGLVVSCPILSVMAWVMGSKDLGKMRARVMDPAGEDMTKVGYALGLFASLIWLLFMLVLMMVVIRNG